MYDGCVKELKTWHRPQVDCLAGAGPDLIAFETIPSIKEAEALVGLLREFPHAKAWLSFSCKVRKFQVTRYIKVGNKNMYIFTGRQAHIGRQPVHRCRPGSEHVLAAGGCRSQLLFSKHSGATAGLGQVPAEARHELGGLPQQWRGVGQQAGVRLGSRGFNIGPYINKIDTICGIVVML